MSSWSRKDCVHEVVKWEKMIDNAVIIVRIWFSIRRCNCLIMFIFLHFQNFRKTSRRIWFNRRCYIKVLVGHIVRLVFSTITSRIKQKSAYSYSKKIVLTIMMFHERIPLKEENSVSYSFLFTWLKNEVVAKSFFRWFLIPRKLFLVFCFSSYLTLSPC